MPLMWIHSELNPQDVFILRGWYQLISLLTDYSHLTCKSRTVLACHLYKSIHSREMFKFSGFWTTSVENICIPHLVSLLADYSLLICKTRTILDLPSLGEYLLKGNLNSPGFWQISVGSICIPLLSPLDSFLQDRPAWAGFCSQYLLTKKKGKLDSWQVQSTADFSGEPHCPGDSWGIQTVSHLWISGNNKHL